MQKNYAWVKQKLSHYIDSPAGLAPTYNTVVSSTKEVALSVNLIMLFSTGNLKDNFRILQPRPCFPMFLCWKLVQYSRREQPPVSDKNNCFSGRRLTEHTCPVQFNRSWYSGWWLLHEYRSNFKKKQSPAVSLT